MDPVKSILFVGRTMQATARLFYDVLPLVVSDDRVQTYFTFDETSEFGDSVARFLDEQQVKLIPWHTATDPGRFHCDVTVSASANANLSRLPGRKLVMAHGAGSHKFRARNGGDEPTVSGLSPRQLLIDGEPIPAAVALAGPDQRHRLRRSCPEAAELAVMTGDVCAERMHASISHRERYRRELGLHPAQRLVVLSSTWGSHSLLAQAPRLADRMLSELSADTYRFAFVIHPNSWDRHGRPQVNGWLADAKRAGLAIIPPHEGWRATVVACDVLIGDHGSVGFYTADLGRPLVYAAFSDTEVPADSPAAALYRAAPLLNPDDDLAPQLDAVIDAHDPDRYRDITAQALDRRGSAAERMRAILYRLLDLDPPPEPTVVEPLPRPETDWTPATALHVHPVPANPADPADPETRPPRLVRFPVMPRLLALRRPFRERVLAVDAAEPDDDLRRSASVLTWTESGLSIEEAAEWSATQLETRPGAALAIARLADDRCFIRMAHGTWIADSHARLEPATLGAAIYLRSPRLNPSDTLRYHESGRDLTVRLTHVNA